MVADFYQSVLKDDRINKYYVAHVSDIAGLHAILSDFLAVMLGGPQTYRGRDLITIHKNMPITSEEYDWNWEHFDYAFRKSGVDEQTIKELK